MNKLTKLEHERDHLSKFITDDDPQKLLAITEWFDLCIEIQKEQSKPLFRLPESETIEERIIERDEKIKQNLEGIKKAWLNLKSELDKHQQKATDLDKKVLTYCFGGIFVCVMCLLIVELVK
tara:strand:- start:580 stop:945 length:366 start_codon:yes stop_codon:yes gene_type:complete